jgi:hypothetical protein
MSRLSDQISGLRRVLLDLNKLIVAEEAQMFLRLPLMTALDISRDDQTPGEPPKATKSENEARLGYGPKHRSLLTRLSNKFKHNRRKNTIDTHSDGTNGIPSLTATTDDP